MYVNQLVDFQGSFSDFFFIAIKFEANEKWVVLKLNEVAVYILMGESERVLSAIK